jgi:hypothetical protein
MADAFYVQFLGLAISMVGIVIVATLAGILLSIIEVKMAAKRDH